MTTLLVVDDDPDIRLLLRYELAAEGHHIVEAGHGEEALARVAEGGVDLVLLDMMMPVLDGWGVLRAIDRGTAPPVVVITALAGGSSSIARRARGGARCMARER